MVLVDYSAERFTDRLKGMAPLENITLVDATMSAFPRLWLRSARLGIAEVREPRNAASYLGDIAA